MERPPPLGGWLGLEALPEAMLRTATAAIAAAALAAAAQTAPVTPAVAEQVVSTDRFPKLHAAYPGGVTGLPDLVYSTIPGFRPLTLDLYMPAKGGAARPLVIYVHGGAWMGGTSRNAAAYADFPAVLADLAARGYVAASLNYRLGNEARWPAASEDVDAAIRWLRAHAGEYGIDKARVAIWGGSAGGQLAALAATDCNPGGGAVESDCVQAAAIWYGVFDIAAQGAPPYFGSNGPKASATAYLDAKDPPFLLIHGAADQTVPVAQSRGMIEKLKAAGVKGEFLELPGIDHSWIGKTPAETTAAHVKALQVTFDFFDATVGKR
jgi:acetyl esterase/lipase